MGPCLATWLWQAWDLHQASICLLTLLCCWYVIMMGTLAGIPAMHGMSEVTVQHVVCEHDSMPWCCRSRQLYFFLSKTAIKTRQHCALSFHLAACLPTRNSCNSLTCRCCTKLLLGLSRVSTSHTLCCSCYFTLHSSLWACFLYQTCS